MRKIRTAIWLTGLMLLLLGSIGVNVFSHTCHEDGEIISYFVAIDNHCDDQLLEVDDCCAAETQCELNKPAHTEEHDCCDDEIKNLKLKLDYFQTSQENDINSIQPVFVQSRNELVSLVNVQPNNYANPPPIPRSERISQNQVWII